jgi:hypothetical protein
MFRKRYLIFATLCAAVAISFIATRKVRSQSRAHQSFTAFQVVKYFDQAGTQRLEETKVYAVKPDGSWVWKSGRRGPDGNLYNFGAIYDVPSKQITTVDGFTDSTTTITMTEAELDSTKALNQSCSSATEHSKILGHDAVKLHAIEPPPQRAMETTDWEAPDLDCFSLAKTEILYGPDSKQVAHNTTETNVVLMGDPSPALFEPPSGYVERGPTEVSNLYQQVFGHKLYSPAALQRAQATYDARHSR